MQELDLAGVPQKVMHLAAANEYRENFSLTDITSSLQAGVGYELVLPGVHSNIGGSYGEITNEEERELHQHEWEQLIAQGWYKREEITRTDYPVYDEETRQVFYSTYSYAGRRLGLTWHYQFIPLAIMAGAAGKLMILESLSPGSRFEKYTLPPDHMLVPVQQAIEQQVAGHGEQGRHVLAFPDDPTLSFNPVPTPVTLPVDFELVQRVRNRYLHRSASRGMFTDGRIGMGDRRKDQLPHRLVFPG